MGRLAAVAIAFAAAATTAVAAPRLDFDGSEFVVAWPDGRVQRSADLVGATLKLDAGGQAVAIEIAAVEEDAHAVGGRLVLHRLLVKDESGLSQPLCKPDPSGRNLAFPVPDGRGGFDLTCTSGAVGKCIRRGYRPWEEQPGGPPLRALHRACVHMTRADYGGDGEAHTRNGTRIDVQDHYGIQTYDGDPSMAFEAAWGEDGAVCVARPRIADLITLERLGERYPRLRSALGTQACDEASAGHRPQALLINRSFR